MSAEATARGNTSTTRNASKAKIQSDRIIEIARTFGLDVMNKDVKRALEKIVQPKAFHNFRQS